MAEQLEPRTTRGRVKALDSSGRVYREFTPGAYSERYSGYISNDIHSKVMMVRLFLACEARLPIVKTFRELNGIPVLLFSFRQNKTVDILMLSPVV